MSIFTTIKRLNLEIEYVNNKKCPSQKEVLAYLHEHDIQISARTFQRDLKQLKVEFGIYIERCKSVNGYFLEEVDPKDLESFYKFSEKINTASFLTKNLSENKKVLDLISFDSGELQKGIKYLEPILSSIKETKAITFSYKSFHTDELKYHTIKPYLLKEYQNRWYVIGLHIKAKEFRTFGLDRIENLKLTSDIFKKDDTLYPKDLFNDIVGLVYSFNKIEKVELAFTPVQGKYIKTLPIHHSQKILIDTEKEFKIELTIIPNYELDQLILSHGYTVKVLKPAWYVNHFKGILKKALKQY